MTMRSDNDATNRPDLNRCRGCTFESSAPTATSSFILLFILLNVAPFACAFPTPEAYRPFPVHGDTFLSRNKSICSGGSGASCPYYMGRNAKNKPSNDRHFMQRTVRHARHYRSIQRKLGLHRRAAPSETATVLERRAYQLGIMHSAHNSDNAISNPYLSSLDSERKDETAASETVHHDDVKDHQIQREELEKEEKMQKVSVAQQIVLEREELQAAVLEVKEAVQEVSQSAKNLGGAMISNGPGIFTRFLTLMVSEEMRWVSFCF